MSEYIARTKPNGWSEYVGELIRCKDCKYWKKSELLGGDMVCDYTYFNKYYRNADDFCSKAERKEDAGSR